MAFSMCILRKSIPCIALLLTFSISAFCGYGVFSVSVTSLVLIISTIIFIFSKQKEEEEVLSNSCNQKQDSRQLEVVKPVKEVEISTEQQCLPHVQKASSEEEPKTETISKEKGHQNGLGVGQIHGYLVRSHHDLYSESESVDHSSSSDQDSDIDWSHSSGNLGQSPECSDDSISDEESLIEIALPSGHYVGPKEDPKFSLQKKFQDFSEKLFDQNKIMELFAETNEMNEEENLIEIDLSMGSIKCSRFEIEA